MSSLWHCALASLPAKAVKSQCPSTFTRRFLLLESPCILTLKTLGAGDTVVTSAGTYPTFNYFSQGLGAEIVEVPYLDDGGAAVRPDLAGLASAAQEHKAALVYIANPDNPTGHVYRYVYSYVCVCV